MKHIMLNLVLAMFVLGSAAGASAKVKVVTTVPDLGSVARVVGGDDVEVEVLCPGDMDPHFLPAKPSLARKLGQADLLVYNGLELEIGWLPQLIGKARNPRIKPGSPGDVDCSQAVDNLLEVPAANVGRGEGDVHPMGNPHYTLDPRRMVKVANYLATRLGQVDPPQAAAYMLRAEGFAAEVKARLAGWQAATASAASLPVIIYHRNWVYLADWLGLNVVGEIEHRPGIAPSPRHVQQLIEVGRQRQRLLIVCASWDHHHVAHEVATRSGGALAVLPLQVGAEAGTDDYLALIDTICRELAAAAAREGG